MKKIKGYISLSIILIIGAIVSTITLSSSLLGISISQMSLSEKQKNELKNLVESCVEDALLYLNKNNSLPSQITLPQITCQININSQNNNTFDFDVTGNKNDHQKTINIKATRTNTILIEKWTEK